MFQSFFFHHPPGTLREAAHKGRLRQPPLKAETKTRAGLTKTQRHQEKSISMTHTLTGVGLESAELYLHCNLAVTDQKIVLTC
ncbi:MAG: hypothetical protein HXY43_10875 [Fischerella sp.]|uniref:hypothetical protein n=1 Tax=Fischerella sp. TaxID=1191 RepID=UPI0017CE0837|nr:hypothetical protein [Fischerella sp.]NWF59769.1 hypothetical protein [Fischerella sp.]